MNPTNTALWYIENHFAEEIALEELANVSGVSRYYLTRAFGEATGQSPRSSVPVPFKGLRRGG